MHRAWKWLAVGPLIAVASGSTASVAEPAREAARPNAQLVSSCSSAAMQKIMEESMEVAPWERKWRIDVKIVDAPNKSLNLSLDVEPMGLSPGGGGIYSYDCRTGQLKLIEGFR